ncbi:hypothetical protein BC936DRAFT_148290 [Jimgerdemannia flammicorona]|uniref:Uncharacterized protein n=1 Tax=Jimgerdemannia flammicorona TaxID=994334 RepID=A0A433DKQ7_9FUNG|nr:hypothetical protein BC936DRAFT_148290 [Jimgerdemannia flammicorona]
MSAEIAQIVGPNNQFQSLVVAGVSLAMYVVATVVFVSRILRHKGYTTPLYLLVALTLVRISQFAVEIPAIQRVNGDRIYSKTLVTVANVLDAMGVGMLFMTTLLSLRSWVVKVRMGTIHPNASQGHNPKTSYFLLFCSLLALLNGILSMVAVGLSVSNGFDAEFDYYTALKAFVHRHVGLRCARYLPPADPVRAAQVRLPVLLALACERRVVGVENDLLVRCHLRRVLQWSPVASVPRHPARGAAVGAAWWILAHIRLYRHYCTKGLGSGGRANDRGTRYIHVMIDLISSIAPTLHANNKN